MTLKQNRKTIARKVALRYLSASYGTELSTVFMSGSSKARLALEKLEANVSKGMDLINDSTHKEHIYAEAGDLISETKALIQEIQEGIAIISYAAAKIEEKKLRNDIPANLRDRIDDSVKRDT